jgi:hypothetical protein
VPRDQKKIKPQHFKNIEDLIELEGGLVVLKRMNKTHGATSQFSQLALPKAQGDATASNALAQGQTPRGQGRRRDQGGLR